MGYQIQTPIIEQLICQAEMKLHIWDDFYCRGVWAALIKESSTATTLESTTNPSDIKYLTRANEILEIDWLPIHLDANVASAIAGLEKKLSRLPSDELDKDSSWITKVEDLYRDTSQVLC